MAKTILAKELKEGKFYRTTEDMFYSALEEADYLSKNELDLFSKLGYIKNLQIIFPKGTPIKFIGNFGGAQNFEIASVSLDMLIDDGLLEEI